jgi:pimeloyl-ACP methyl ester carboxylesterase
MKTNIGLWAILLLAISMLFIGSIGWKKWLLTRPQLLPPKATFTGTDRILPGYYYEVSVPPSKEDDYQSADFRIWIPQDVQTIRGLIVKQHGCGDAAAATGLDHANDLQWQALATKHQFALIGAKFPSGKQPCEYWVLVNYGSGDAFLEALHAFGEQSQHPELDLVPWVLWGHSGGADWSTQILQQYPERTIAVIAARGGALTLLGSNPTLASIPVLFAIGEKDKLSIKELHDLPKQVFDRYRKLDAPWTLAIEAQTGHETGDTRLLAIPYLDAILTTRLPEHGDSLRPIDLDLGWLGDTVTHKIAPVSQFEGNQREASWLPDRETARKWHQYVTKGKIAPTRKPTVPTKVQAIKTASTAVILTWSYTPDLENGLPSFRIYRDGDLIQTFRGQDHNFGDAPDPATVLLEFQDRDAKSNSSYSVGAFNLLGENISSPIQLTDNK